MIRILHLIIHSDLGNSDLDIPCVSGRGGFQ